MSLAQAYVYWLNSKRDSSYLKATVWTVMSVVTPPQLSGLRSSSHRILETVHTAAVVHFIYHYTISSFGNFGEVGKINWYRAISATLPLHSLMRRYIGPLNGDRSSGVRFNFSEKQSVSHARSVRFAFS